MVAVEKFGNSRMKDRKLNRLEGYDYSKAGCYFVTVCVRSREELLGEIVDGEMVLNQTGEIVDTRWRWLSERYDYVESDEYVVMPNHFHGILIIQPHWDRSRPVPTDALKIKSLSELVGAFKTTSSKRIREHGLACFNWQRSFYDHVIRDDDDLNRIREYIQNNPLKWSLDEYNPTNQVGS